MRMSRLFFKTLREVPSDAEVVSHQLLLRASLIRQVGAGIFEYLPLGQRVKAKVEAILRDEMDAIDGQEVTMPFVHPAELWQRSGRWYQIGNDMARLTDWSGREYCLAMTHEEVVTDLASRVVSSYKQLPFTLYQIQTKFRDEPRPRAGLIRVREFTMKDGYSFHRDLADLDAYYPRVYQAYFNIFRRCGLPVMAVASDPGMMGGSLAHEFMAINSAGEDTVMLCSACGYRANRQVAAIHKPALEPAELLPLEPVHTPGTSTIEALAAFLGVPESHTAKAVFVVAEVADGTDGTRGAREQFVFAIVRGDMDLNETKLGNAVGARRLRPAEPGEIRAIGAEPGFGSPIGVDRAQIVLVVDDLIPASPNLVAGANRPDTHYRNVNYDRDFEADMVLDIVAAADGQGCPRCASPLGAERAVEVGNIFKLGTKYSEAFGAHYLDEDGKAHPMAMGCYGIGTGRLIASVLEGSHDEAGIVWPVTIAPYHVSLVALKHKSAPEVEGAADRLYEAFGKRGVEMLYDDRSERAGVKFNDADLIGLPVRITVGARGLAGGFVEVKERRSDERAEIPIDDVVDEVVRMLDAQRAEIAATIVAEPLGDG